MSNVVKTPPLKYLVDISSKGHYNKEVLTDKGRDGDSKPAGTQQRAGEGGIPVQVVQR